MFSALPPNAVKSSKNRGYDFATHSAPMTVVVPSAIVASMAADIAMRWSPKLSMGRCATGLPPVTV